MGKSKINLITSFNGGLASDRRVNQSNKFALTKHFDAFRYKHKLVPHYNTEADEVKPATMTRFVIGIKGSSHVIYALGDSIDTTDLVSIYEHNAGVTLGWVKPSNYESTIDYDLLNGNVFFEYKDKIYTFADNRLINFTIGGSWDNTGEDFGTVTTVADPVHHPNDDIAYFFYNNIVGKIDGAGSYELALTLPSNLKIMSATPYGNYLAIGCSTKDVINPSSVVFLWDRDSSLTTLTDRIDFGEGVIETLANLDNKLIALMSYHLSDIYGTDGGKVIIKQAIGDKATIINNLLSDEVIAIGIMANGVVEDNKLYQAIAIKKNGDFRKGIWVIDSNGKATLDYVEEDVADDGTAVYNGILKTGNVWTIAHSSDGSVNRTKITSGAKYTFTSKYESLIFDEGDNSKSKKLIGVTVMTEALPTNGQIVLKYRKDKDLVDGAWTTIFTEATDDSIEFDAINISGATLPEYKEIQFRIESTGGAVITGLKWKAEIIDKQKY